MGTVTLVLPNLPLASALIEPPIRDVTGIGDAMVALARIGVGFLYGVLTLVLVALGYHYMTTDEMSRGVHFKRTIFAVAGGTILILVAVTFGPQLIGAIVASHPTPAPVPIPAPNTPPTPTLPPLPTPPPHLPVPPVVG